jgi:RNA polymerase sigma-70 factor (ECF subfamily)
VATSIAFPNKDFALHAAARPGRAAASARAASLATSGADEALMRAFCDGDDSAFEALYERYKRAIYRFVYRRIGDQGRAEELTADVFTAVVRYRATYRPDAMFKTYLYRIAENRCISERQRAERRHVVAPKPVEDDTPAPEPVAAGESPADAAERGERCRMLYAAIDRLPEAFRAPLLLELADFGRDEIAEHLSIPVETVKTRIFRAKARLKVILDAMSALRP